MEIKFILWYLKGVWQCLSGNSPKGEFTKYGALNRMVASQHAKTRRYVLCQK